MAPSIIRRSAHVRLMVDASSSASVDATSNSRCRLTVGRPVDSTPPEPQVDQDGSGESARRPHRRMRSTARLLTAIPLG